MIPAVFKDLCPEGDLKTHDRSRCIEEEILQVRSNLNDYERFFEICLGSPPWEIQRMWAKRALAGRSFAAIAPTGVGKTAFGLVTSYYFAMRRKKSYLIFPTSLLVDQALEILKRCEESAGEPLRVLAYKRGMKSEERKSFYERLESGDFYILVTTSQYLARNHDRLRDFVGDFHFIFVDDVDAFLRSSKNVDRVLTLMGFSENDIRAALRGEEVDKKVDSILVVSTATGRPGPRVSLFRRLLGFDVGILRQEMLRNIADLYTKRRSDLERFMGSMGSGFLLFVPKMELAEEARALAERAGFKVGVLHGYDGSLIESFKSGELDGLIGAARPYSVLVRGLDLPHRIRYVIFYGIPRFEISLKDVDEMSNRTVAITLSALAKGLDQQSKRFAIRLRRHASEADLSKARELLKEILSSGDKLRKLSGAGDVLIEVDGSRVVIPDIRTYIQGSGRSSRLYPGGITRGASLVWDEDPLLTSFIKRASAYDIDLAYIDEIDLVALRREIDESRKRYSSLKTGFELAGLLKTALFIVESPNKARTIARFFGKPGIRIINGHVAYEVTTGDYVLTIMASGGHVVDLSTQEGYHGTLIEGNGRRTYIPVYASIKRCLDCGHQFTDGNMCPRCGSINIRDSRDNVISMRKLGFEVSRVIIGTDPDTEGEKIAWDIYQLIRDATGEVYRAEFHEVTKGAILEALSQLGETKEPRVRAQIVRRVEDRWIGFELSYEVQKKFNRRNLSAGRAQTPTLGWIIERYEQHKKKRYVTVIRGKDISLRLEGKIGSPGTMEARVVPVELREEVVKPLPPFTTDEMIREANRVLRLGAKRVMEAAQSLFEAGLITYHRTDSARVSYAGLRVAAEVLGDEFVPREWGEGGAHECIRPTKPLTAKELLDYVREGLITPPEGFSKDHIKLYDLIFRRFISSQAKESVLVKQFFKLILNEKEIESERILGVKGGWALIYPFLYPRNPPLSEGIVRVEIKHLQVPSVPLLSQGDLVALMKEKGIGRPSTYATIIDRLLQRRYVIESYNKLIPTRLGIQVYDFLTAEYPDLISEERTRILEEKMASVEEGKLDYQELIEELYREIQEKVVRKRGA